MTTEKQVILFGAGSKGIQALNFYGIKNVFCFADTYKVGQTTFGKKTISPDKLVSLYQDYDVIVSSLDHNDEMKKFLKQAGVPFRDYCSEYIDYQKNNYSINPAIAELKDKHKGDKIFLIGNGPSLCVEDLEGIRNSGIITMACNFINKIFDKTSWRPDYYCCIETSAIILNKEFIANYPLKMKFIKVNHKVEHENIVKKITEKKDVVLINVGGSVEKFSEDIAKVVYDGRTVMFPMIQLAIYMGFTELYLLGVDNTQPPSVHTADFIEANAHFYEEDADVLSERRAIMSRILYMDDDYTDSFGWYHDKTNIHYKVARDYAEAHNIKIFNATRGGKLEVFERVAIESLLL